MRVPWELMTMNVEVCMRCACVELVYRDEEVTEVPSWIVGIIVRGMGT
jgi:hypothetical protein